VRRQPLHSHGHRGHREREGQVIKTEIKTKPVTIFDSHRTRINCSLAYPEKHGDDIIDEITRVLDYAGVFDFLKQKQS